MGFVQIIEFRTSDIEGSAGSTRSGGGPLKAGRTVRRELFARITQI